MQIIKYPPREIWASLLTRPVFDNTSLFDTVQKVLDDVRLHGDVAIKKYTLQFDKVESDIIEVTKEEMYWMNPNVFSISPEVVVSEKNFTRLNDHLENVWNIKVERINYREISKMGGLLRCSTMPLIRK